MNKQNKIIILTIAAFIAIFFIGSYLFKQNTAEKTAEKTKEIISAGEASLIRDYSPTKGSPNAKVTLVEFLDPECESCAFFHPIVKGLLKKYEGQIRYIIRYAPFHPNSKFAVKVLEGARAQNKYWETLDLLFENLSEWGSHHNPRPELIWTYLPKLNLNIDEIKNNLENEKVLAMIDQEYKDLQAFEVRQTPTFFVNGKPLQSFGVMQLEQAIKDELNK